MFILRILLKKSRNKTSLFRLLDTRKGEQYPVKFDFKWEMNKDFIAGIGRKSCRWQTDPDPNGVFCLQAELGWDHQDDIECMAFYLMLLKFPGGAYDIDATCKVNDDAGINKDETFSINIKGNEENPLPLREGRKRMECIPLEKLMKMDSYTLTVSIKINASYTRAGERLRWKSDEHDYAVFQRWKEYNDSQVKMNKESDVKEPNTSVYLWLKDIGFPEYYDIFVKNGFGDIRSLKFLNTDGLEKIGIRKLGHRFVIDEEIAKLVQNLNFDNPTELTDRVFDEYLQLDD